MAVAPDNLPFPAGDRFELIALRGSGGMGVVYEVLDRQRQVRVALKAVRHAGARQLLRLKNEFRALRDLSHPNLIRLGELFEDEGKWFFTMELVDGVDFREWTRPVGALAVAAAGTGTTTIQALEAPQHVGRRDELGTDDTRAMPLRPAPNRPLTAVDVLARSSRVAQAPGFDEARLRSALRQLAAGVAALHRAGMVHRDIKPSNVLVEADGRLVLLDFGVVAELRERPDEGNEREVVGTWAYMPSEQAAGRDPSPAADWYSVGVMLFEALTGELPFSADEAGLHLKAALEAPSPSALTLGVPADLETACVRLLAREPAARPTGDQVLALLGLEAGTAGGGAAYEGREPPALPYVGRGAELSMLRGAYERSRAGEPGVVLVCGESGMGKSALVARFLDELADAEQPPLVLEARCDAREIVPYNAFDGIVDRLARTLTRMAPEQVAALVPPGADALLRVFPVLAGVEALEGATRTGRRTSDERGAAFTALAELLRRLAALRPLVLTIDDVHWADADSRALFTELMNGRQAPPLLLVATARGLPGDPPPAALGEVRTPVQLVQLAPLEPADAERLARAAFASLPPGSTLDPSAIAREAAGHPMFVTELARFTSGSGEDGHPLLLDEVLWRRIEALDVGGRRLLELVCLAAAPLSRTAAAAAAGIAPAELSEQLAELARARLLRVLGGRDLDAIEPYHDRVREAVAARLDEHERKGLHRRLARVLDTRSAAPELLAYHLIGAGDHTRAASMALLASRRAQAALAFERAAEWLTTALSLAPPEPTERRALLAELGELLVRAGRPEEAADTFTTAAATGHPDDDERRELRRRAAASYINGGYLEKGMAAIHELLEEVDLHAPASAAGAIVGVLFNQARLALSPLTWTPRREEDVPRATLARLDVCWSTAMGLSLVDSLRGALFATRLPLMCLAAGEPHRIARSLAGAATAAAGLGRVAACRRFGDAARQAAVAADSPLVRGHLAIAELGRLFYLENDWPAAFACSEQAARDWLDAGQGRGWELDVLTQHTLWSMMTLGHVGELCRRVPAEIRAARRGGNRFLEVGLRTFFPIVHLAEADDPAGARADVDEALASWTHGQHEVGNQFFFAQKGRSAITCYAGDILAHAESLETDWQRCWRSLLVQVPMIRMEVAMWRGQLALARAVRARQRGDAAGVRRLLDVSRRWAARVRKVGLPICVSAELQVMAGVYRVDGRDADAAAALRQLLENPIFQHMSSGMAAVRWHLGTLLGGSEGEALRRVASAWYASQGAVRPDRMAASMLPGCELAG